MVWANARSLATTSAITIVFFSSGYLDVSVLRVRLLCRITCLQHAGLPHSDTCGSKSMCLSPQLFAACRVLHRLWEPRHSPYALIQLMCFYLICSCKLWVKSQELRITPLSKQHNSFINLLYLYLAIQKFKCSRILVFQYVNERYLVVSS